MGSSIGYSNVEFAVISGAELGDHRLGIELSGTSSGAAVEDRVNLWPSKFEVIDQIWEAGESRQSARSQKRGNAGAYLICHIDKGLSNFSCEVGGQPRLVPVHDNCLDLGDDIVRKERAVIQVPLDRGAEVGTGRKPG